MSVALTGASCSVSSVVKAGSMSPSVAAAVLLALGKFLLLMRYNPVHPLANSDLLLICSFGLEMLESQSVAEDLRRNKQ